MTSLGLISVNHPAHFPLACTEIWLVHVDLSTDEVFMAKLFCVLPCESFKLSFGELFCVDTNAALCSTLSELLMPLDYKRNVKHCIGNSLQE